MLGYTRRSGKTAVRRRFSGVVSHGSCEELEEEYSRRIIQHIKDPEEGRRPACSRTSRKGRKGKRMKTRWEK